MLPNQPLVHLQMLTDKVRINHYREALTRIVRPEDVVIDAGAGLGILARFAAQHTENQVLAIEYYESTTQVARALCQELPQIQVVCENAAEFTTQAEPQILVTETIGPVGPEEGITELCYILKKRYPSIRTIIPCEIKIFAIPLKYPDATQRWRHIENDLKDLSDVKYQLDKLIGSFEEAYCRVLFGGDLSEAQPLDDPIFLHAVKLGDTCDPSFEKRCDVATKNADIIHLYFEASLAPGVVLSSAWNQPLTHWKHRYVHVPSDGKTIRVAFDRACDPKNVNIWWET